MSKKTLLALLAFVILAGIFIGTKIITTDAGDDVPYTVLENKIDDQAAQSTVTQHILIDPATKKEDVERLLGTLFKEAEDTELEKREHPTHIYIYAYTSQANYGKKQYSAMISRVLGGKSGIEFKR